MANREKKTIVTRKHLARAEHEAVQKRYLTIGITSIIAIVVILIIVGFVLEGVIAPRQPIVKINDTVVTTKDYQTRVRFQRYNLVNQYANYFQFIQSLGDPNSASYFQTTLMQIQTQLQPEVVGFSVIEDLIQDALIREEAEKLGISVSKADIKKEIAESIFQYYEDGSPPPAAVEEIQPTATLSVQQQELLRVTPEDTDATPPEVEAEPPAEVPVPTPYTKDAFETDLDNFYNGLESFGKINQNQLYKIIESQLLRDEVIDVIVPTVVSEEERVWALHILFRSEETGEDQALEVINRLAAGEHFLDIADELATAAEDAASQTTGEEENPVEPQVRFENLGWFGEGMMVPAFQEAAFRLEIGEHSQPVKTSFGWHVIQVIGKEVQTLTETEISQLRQTEFQQWLTDKRSESQVDITPDWISAVPTDPDIPEYMQLNIPTP
jgi:peptidyl-prolyl cis-trans isomerase D